MILELRQQLQASQLENKLLRHKLDVLCRRMFGRKADKVDPQQLQLALEQLANEQEGSPQDPVEMDSGESTKPDEKPQRAKKPVRRALPSNLPRRRVVIDVADAEKVCGCCGSAKALIGEDVNEKLDYVPGVVEVVETARLKYACDKCHEGVTVAPAPPQAIEKAIPGEGLLAHVVVSKYGDHLPLFRLERIFARHGLHIPRSTMCNWLDEVALALSPIEVVLRQSVISASYLQTDDTPLTVLSSSGPFKGRLWTYLDPIGRRVVYDATPTHERVGPERFLERFRGYLQADAYTGYDALYRTGRMVEVGCWAHTRRRFVDAQTSDSNATRMIALIRELYAVEHDTADVTPEERVRVRAQRSVAILARIDEERMRLAVSTLPKSPLGEALRYLANQRQALGRFVEDGRLRLDNNGAESQLRVVALGRKNWLFAGSMDAAGRTAVLYTLVQNCKLAGVEPWAYLRSVLIEVATTPHWNVASLTPQAWAARHAPVAALSA